MKIDTPDSRTRVLLTDDGTEIGRIRRKSWFGQTAELFTGGSIYLLKTFSFRQKLTLLYNASAVLEITFPWRGGAHLQDLTNADRSFTVKEESIWRSSYQLKDKSQNTLASFRIAIDWRRFRQVINLSAPDSIADVCPPWVLLSAVHAIMVRQARRAAAS